MKIHKYKCTNTVSIESSLKTRHPPPPPFPPAGSTLPRAVRSIPAFLSYSGFDNPEMAGELYGGEVINRFAIIHLIIGMTLPFISTLLVLMYDIDRSKHNSHITDLGYTSETKNIEPQS